MARRLITAAAVLMLAAAFPVGKLIVANGSDFELPQAYQSIT